MWHSLELYLLDQIIARFHRKVWNDIYQSYLDVFTQNRLCIFFRGILLINT